MNVHSRFSGRQQPSTAQNVWLGWFGLVLVASAHLAPAANGADDVPVKPSRDQCETLYQARVYQSATSETLPYRMLAPKNPQPGKRYPLVLFLHGAGERGDDNRLPLVHAAAEFARDDRRDAFPAFVVFPQCPKGKRWVESDWNLESGRGLIPAEPSTAMRLTLELVDNLIQREAIDSRRLYVAGLSMGGQGAWFAAAAPPKRFAALLAVCGGSDPDWAPRYAGINIWAFHGQEDRVVPVSRGREMVAALANAGHTPELRYVEYPGVGHDSWTQTFARDDVFQWLFSQSK
jgi:predicted peptidase